MSEARDGWKLVPIEPTEAMYSAASIKILPSYAGQLDHQHAYDIVSEEDMRTLYKAMLAAAPTTSVRKANEEN